MQDFPAEKDDSNREHLDKMRRIRDLLHEMDICDRKLSSIEARRRDSIDKIDKKTDLEKEPILKKKKEFEKEIKDYLKSNKESLLKLWAKKSTEFLYGTVGWEVAKMSIAVSKNKVPSIIKLLWSKRSTRRYVKRTVTFEINKDELLKNPEFANSLDGIIVRNIKKPDTLFVRQAARKKTPA